MAQSALPLLSNESARPLDRLLPPGWRVIASARGGSCHVLAHPAEGVVLLKVATRDTPGLEHRLGTSMTAAGLRPGGHAPLPVWYMRIDPAQLRRLDALLADALAAQPSVLRDPQRAWVDSLARALRADPEWGGRRPPRLPVPPQGMALHLAAVMLLLLAAGLALWLGFGLLPEVMADRSWGPGAIAAAQEFGPPRLSATTR